MEYLFVTPTDLKATTILGGNVDQDKFLPCIASVQLTVIEPLLGTELYDVIAAGAEANTLDGKYLELYNNYIKPIVKNQSIAEYVLISSFVIANGGAYKHQADNTENMTGDELSMLASKYSGLADVYIQRFEKWIDKNDLDEYKTIQDEVNASTNVGLRGGWWFGRDSNAVEQRRDNDAEFLKYREDGGRY